LVSFKVTSINVNLLVTGASRGIGRGIATELGANHATVYITGRKEAPEDIAPGCLTLEQVAEEINKRGGIGIPVYCDHSEPAEIKKLFERIDNEQSGKLDILVNNAFSGVFHMSANLEKKFYEFETTPEFDFDIINNVGLRNNYICSVYAARMMVKQKSGLLVNISSLGGINYLMNVAYGTGKAGLIRMSADMAIELADKNVQSIALLPNAVKTEIVQQTVMKGPEGPIKDYFKAGESIYYSGKVLSFLASHPDLMMRFNGQAVPTTEIIDEFGIVDIDGHKHRDERMDKFKDYVAKMNAVHLDALPK